MRESVTQRGNRELITFDCAAPESPELSQFLKKYGWEGYGHICALMARAESAGAFDLTADILSTVLKLRSQRIPKILQDYQRIFKILEDSSRSGGEKPHGSTRAGLVSFNKLNTKQTTTGEKFQDGFDLLVWAGMDEPQARTLLGRWARQYSDSALEEAISATIEAGDSVDNPKNYIAGCLRRAKQAGDNDQSDFYKQYAF